MTRIAVLGAAGYSAKQLLQLLLRHPHAEIVALTTRQDDRPHVADVHPVLRSRLDLPLENLNPQQTAERAQCVFSCLPHAASAEFVKDVAEAGCRVIDFSADYRLKELPVYQQWYQTTHPDPGRIAEAVYGLPELFRSEIVQANLVANPGCYPTSAILALAPLLQAGVVQREGVIVDSKSGVSGAGRTPKPNLHYPECNESVAAYGVGQHRHTPEIDQALSVAAGGKVEVVFTPHLIPMDRGILTTAYALPVSGCTESDALEALQQHYADEPFVRVVDQLPSTKQTTGTNFCDIAVRAVRGRLVVVSVIDNLIKGAAGAAVQNFNLMFGYDERTAL